MNLEKDSHQTINNKNINNTNKKSLIENFIKTLTNEQKMKFWFKTLFSSYGSIPEVIKTLDKIIELQASSLSFASDVFNKENTTINQVEKIIDLSERKKKLLNIHLMTKKLLNNLSFNDCDFLEKRFCLNWTADDLANEFNISTRTVYRKIDKLINDVYANAQKNNWSLAFLESQIKDEFWLKEKFKKQISDYFKNSNYFQGKLK